MSIADKYTSFYCTENDENKIKLVEDEIDKWLEENKELKEKLNSLQVITLESIFENLIHHKQIISLRNLFREIIKFCSDIPPDLRDFNTYLNIGRLLIGNKTSDHRVNTVYLNRLFSQYYPNSNNFIKEVEVEEKLIKGLKKSCEGILEVFDLPINQYIIELMGYEQKDDNLDNIQLLIGIKYYNFLKNTYFMIPSYVNKICSSSLDNQEIIISTGINLNPNPILKARIDDKEAQILKLRKELNMISAYASLLKMLREEAREILTKFNFIIQTTCDNKISPELKEFFEEHGIKNYHYFEDLNNNIKKHINDLRKFHSLSLSREKSLNSLVSSELLLPAFSVNELELIKIALIKTCLPC
jgi:hypothetical protein